MWTCPECDRQFANPHQWHSCGEFRIHPQQTRAVSGWARATAVDVGLRPDV